tara:strand:+ start:830 stop:1105 length:276 start_codon:yes stop_codon:yes gene_type:complete
MAKTITVKIDDTDEKVMLNDLTDIDEWVQDAVTGKINNCWKRMQQNWTNQLMNDESFTDSIPSNKADFVKMVTARSDYKDRVARDKEEKSI